MRTIAWTAALALASIAGSAEEIRLAMTSMSPAASNNSVYFNAWAQRVNEQSGGTLKVEVKKGQALAHFGNVYDRVTNDVVQIGWSILRSSPASSR
jgi:TRAP-type C4-dicarboxylate transport system substrate-binding protein